MIIKEVVDGDCPQQENGYDCGVFILAVAVFLTEGMPINRKSFRHDVGDVLREDVRKYLKAEYFPVSGMN
jgi:Ulp1 family protease